MKNKTISEILDDLKEQFGAERLEEIKDVMRDIEIQNIKSVPVEWLEKHIVKNHEEIYADNKITQEYSELGYACEMVLVNYRVDMLKEKSLWWEEE